MWRPRPELKDSYDVVIIGGGSHGLATAYYLARDHGVTNVAVLEKNYIGSGAAGRNTTILRSNYKTPEGARFYDASVKLYEGLGKELNFNLLFSQNGHLTLAHSDRAMFVMANRAEVNRLHNIDSRLIYPDEIKKLAPAMQVDNPDAVYPIQGALYHPPGGVIRHDAVVWGLARGADKGGAEIHPYTEVTGINRSNGKVTGVRTNRGEIKTPVVLNCTAGWSSLISDMAGVRHADHHPHPAGLRDRADEAAPRRGDRVVADARVHLADRPRRVADGRGDRALDHLPNAGHAELPAGGVAPLAGAVPAAGARPGAAELGRAVRPVSPTTARSSARPRSRAST